MLTINSTRPSPSPVSYDAGTMTPAQRALVNQLKALEAETLLKLERSFYDTAARCNGKTQSQGFTPFAAKKPREAFEQSKSHLENTYFTGPKDGMRPSGIDSAAQATKGMQSRSRNFLADQLGAAFTSDEIASALGPNACFEDALAMAMMNIAEKSEREVMEQIRGVERGDTGLSGAIANGARALGGAAGGAIGGYVGGLSGAAIGHDVGERIAGGAASQYGGSSRQVQFEKLKMSITRQSEMMQAISNILSTIHTTNKNTIGNMRA